MKLLIVCAGLFILAGLFGCRRAQVRNVVLTGYWPPSNQMLAEFSTDKQLNPAGWKGKNWRGLGYDVYSFFPKLDYQGTRADFALTTQAYKPIAIICYGTTTQGTWEIEQNATVNPQWNTELCQPPLPDINELRQMFPANVSARMSLPAHDIAKAVNAAPLGIAARVNADGDAGTFLCNYIALLAVAYQKQHNTPNALDYCAVAGFIHIGAHVSVTQARAAQRVVLATVLRYISTEETPCSP